MKLTDIDDNGLVRLALEGSRSESEAAFFAIYARYHKAVSGHIAKYVKETEEIEDICMESFEKAFHLAFQNREEHGFRPSGKEQVNGQES